MFYVERKCTLFFISACCARVPFVLCDHALSVHLASTAAFKVAPLFLSCTLTGARLQADACRYGDLGQDLCVGYDRAVRRQVSPRSILLRILCIHACICMPRSRGGLYILGRDSCPRELQNKMVSVKYCRRPVLDLECLTNVSLRFCARVGDDLER